MTWNDDFTAGYNWAVIKLEASDAPTPASDHKLQNSFHALLDYADAKSGTPEAEKIREIIINAWFPEDE